MNKYTISFLDTKTPPVVIECDKVAEMNGNLYAFVGTTTVGIYRDWKSVTADGYVKKADIAKVSAYPNVGKLPKPHPCTLCHGCGTININTGWPQLCPVCQPRISL